MGPSTGYQMGVPHSSHFRWTMYRLVPGGLHDSGPNPQPELPPALPQRPHFSSSSSSLLRTYCFWPRLRCTELGCILLSSFSPGDLLNQSPGARYSVARPPPFLEALRLCVHPPHDGVALLAALLRKMRLTNSIIRFSGISGQHISESQCLGAGLPLFTESPRRLILGNSHSPRTRVGRRCAKLEKSSG